MPLTTRCGRCGRLFPVSAQQLKGNRGRVACPQCGARINAVAGLLDEPMFAGEPPPPRHRNGADAQRRGQERGGTLAAAAPALMRTATLLTPLQPRRSALAQAGWGLAMMILIMGLGAQLAWWKRSELLRNPAAFRALSTLCNYLGCELPLVHLPGAVAVHEPSLDPDPANGALMLRLRIENRAALPQPAPLIELELFDQQGELAAARRFSPDEYAAGASQTRSGWLAPGETQAVALALAPPREASSGFKVRLH